MRSSNKPGLIIALAILLSTVPPLSSDLYLPGLPLLTTDLGSDPSMASQTLTVFFLFMAIGTLFSGTISDKTGRRPMLLVSSLIAVGSCIGCAFAPNVETLLVLRSFQGLAGGGLTTGGMIIVKDCFSSDRMSRVFALTQAVAMIAPVTAPLLGVAVLAVGSWRGSFIVVAMLLAICLVLSLCMKETLPKEEREKTDSDSIQETVSLLRKGFFILPLMIAALFNASFMSYLGNASYVYEDYFGLSATMFGVIFAITSFAAIAGPLVYMRIEKGLNTPRAITFFVVLMGVMCVPLLLFGKNSPWAFMPCMAVLLFSSAFVRPMVASFLLEPLTSAVGAASSIINFAIVALGCVGMFIGTMGFGFVEGVQTVAASAFILMVIFWVLYCIRYRRS